MPAVSRHERNVLQDLFVDAFRAIKIAQHNVAEPEDVYVPHVAVSDRNL